MVMVIMWLNESVHVVCVHVGVKRLFIIGYQGLVECIFLGWVMVTNIMLEHVCERYTGLI